MRGVIDQGTGAAIRSRYGMRADVAGKTGTTQDNTDGWFILMHPQLVAGAWVGFNDNRVTMRSDSWGQGARSALPIVGEFFQQAIKAKVVDAEMRFPAPQGGGVTDVEQQRIEALLNGAEPPQEGQPGEVPAGVGMAGASTAVEGGAPRWQPAPVIKYVTIQVPAESTPPAVQGGDSGGIVPRCGAAAAYALCLSRSCRCFRAWWSARPAHRASPVEPLRPQLPDSLRLPRPLGEGAPGW